MDLIQMIETMASSSNESFLDIAELIWELKRTDPDAFRTAWMVLPMSKRKTYALAKVGEIFDEFEHSRERLTAIGWTKLEMIAEHVTPKTIPMFLSLAERFTARDLRRILHGKPALGKANILQLALSDDEYEIVAGMLVRHGASQGASGLTGKEQSLVKAAIVLAEFEKANENKD